MYILYFIWYFPKYFLDTMRIALFPPRVYNNGIKEREVLHMTYLAYIVVFSLLALEIYPIIRKGVHKA